MEDRPAYPFVVKNRTALFVRGFMNVFLIGCALITYMIIRDNPEPHRWAPLIMLAFWACGLFGLVHALNQETSEVQITSPGSIHIRRGKAFRRQEHWTDRARFWIEDTKDSDGDPYFKLWMDAPGGKLAVSEGHQRAQLEKTQGTGRSRGGAAALAARPISSQFGALALQRARYRAHNL